MKWTILNQPMALSAIRRVASGLIAVAVTLSFTAHSRADKLAELLFWHEMGKATNNAVKSHNDYRRERQQWRDQIAAAKAALERCGGCASAQTELKKWQGIENQFQDFAGSVFSAVGMPPVVAQWLGIQMPFARGFTAEERARMCEVKRQPWVAERSALCQRKVDEHLACLRASMKGAGICDPEASTLPGQACYRTAKYYEHCYNANDTAVALEAKAEAERARGRILPELVERGTVKIVFFDDAPDAFAPPLPPLEIARDIIDGNAVQELKFRMRKSGRGTLRQATIRRFHWHDFALDDRCFERGAVKDEIDLRVCEDLKEMNFIHRPFMLLCDYTGVDPALGAHAIFWYGVRPTAAVADPRNYLKRSRNHPFSTVADARSDCPATIEEAGQVRSRFGSTLASLGVEEVPGSVALRSNWDEELRSQQRAQQEALRTEALASFTIEGVYAVEFTTGWSNKRRPSGIVMPVADRKSRAECAVRKTVEGKFRLSCREPYKTTLAQFKRADQPTRGALRKFEVDAVVDKGWLVVHWMPDLSIQHSVQSGRLWGWHKPDGDFSYGMISSMMSRKGDLDSWDPASQLGELPELRAYEAMLRSRGVTSLDKLAAISDADLVSHPLVYRRLRDLARDFLKPDHQAARPTDSRNHEDDSSAARATDGTLTGVWKGRYRCGGEPIALELTLSELDGGLLWGTFAFAPLPENPRIQSGRFYVWGRKHAGRQDLELVDGPWIDRPRGYVSIGLSGRYGSREPDASDPATGRIVGRTTGRCAEFEVRRLGGGVASLGRMPAEIAQKLKQYGFQPSAKEARLSAPPARHATLSGRGNVQARPPAGSAGPAELQRLARASGAQAAARCTPADIVIVSNADDITFRDKSVKARLRGVRENDRLLREAYPKLKIYLLPEGEVHLALERGVLDIAAYRCADLQRDRAGFLDRFKTVWLLTKEKDDGVRLEKLTATDAAAALPGPVATPAPEQPR
ncbi:MAG: hypothetical protein M5U07_11150 [Xanthobacteraceae bacterium]|nr:hypothetical protein [Xanthobacteraceae bacterium]